jgi:hypothetical protein
VVELTHFLGLNAHEHYKYSNSFSRSGDQHKKANATKKLIQKVTHQLVLCHNLKARIINEDADNFNIDPNTLQACAKQRLPLPANGKWPEAKSSCCLVS